MDKKIKGYLEKISRLPSWLYTFAFSFDEQIGSIYARRYLNEDKSLSYFFIYFTKSDLIKSFVSDLESKDNFPTGSINALCVEVEEVEEGKITKLSFSKSLQGRWRLPINDADEKLLELVLENIATISCDIKKNDKSEDRLFIADINIIGQDTFHLTSFDFKKLIEEEMIKITDADLINKLKGLKKNNYSVDLLLNYNLGESSLSSKEPTVELKFELRDSVSGNILDEEVLEPTANITEEVISRVYKLLTNLGSLKKIRVGNLFTYLMLEHLCHLAGIELEVL